MKIEEQVKPIATFDLAKLAIRKKKPFVVNPFTDALAKQLRGMAAKIEDGVASVVELNVKGTPCGQVWSIEITED